MTALSRSISRRDKSPIAMGPGDFPGFSPRLNSRLVQIRSWREYGASGPKLLAMSGPHGSHLWCCRSGFNQVPCLSGGTLVARCIFALSHFRTENRIPPPHRVRGRPFLKMLYAVDRHAVFASSMNAFSPTCGAAWPRYRPARAMMWSRRAGSGRRSAMCGRRNAASSPPG
jgi:hypothetical protein